jgi:hypothetical protein
MAGLGVVMALIFGYGSFLGAFKVYERSLDLLDEVWDSPDVLYEAGSIVVVVLYPLFYLLKALYLVLKLTIDFQLGSFAPSDAILEFIAPSVDFLWPIRDGASLMDNFFLTSLWKAFGAISFALAIWLAGLDDFIQQSELITPPTRIDRGVAVLVCLFALLVLIVIPSVTGSDPTEGALQDLAFAVAVVLGAGVCLSVGELKLTE